MKKLITLLLFSVGIYLAYSQVPVAFNYQAVVRDATGNIVANQMISLKISILKDSLYGSTVYAEIHNKETNNFGLINLVVGEGQAVYGVFSPNGWDVDKHFIKYEIDVNGGSSYVNMGTSQLLSVPYAFHAQTAETFTETDPVYKGSQAANITTTDITNLGNLSGSNTGDQDLNGLATTTALTAGLNTKVDKELGKGLSTNDYTTAEQIKLAGISGINTGDQDISAMTHTNRTALDAVSGINTGDQKLSGLATTTDLTAGLDLKVDKETGKGLSTNDYTTAEKTKLAGIASGAEVNVQANWNQTTTTADDYIKNKPLIPVADGSETKLIAGTNVTVTGTGTTENPYVVNATGGTTVKIGDSYQGGIIFWIDATGQHGLIAATSDQSIGIQWYNGTYRYTGTSGDGLYAGVMNTALILATQMADNQTGNFAAKVCADYSVTVDGINYGDWYLPSKYELNLLYKQKNTVGGFTGTNYWSSSEINNYNAYGIVFSSGANLLAGKTTTNYVRAIRAF